MHSIPYPFPPSAFSHTQYISQSVSQTPNHQIIKPNIKPNNHKINVSIKIVPANIYEASNPPPASVRLIHLEHLFARTSASPRKLFEYMWWELRQDILYTACAYAVLHSV